MMEPLVVTGHFAEPEAETCRPALEPRCRATLIVSEVDGLVH